LKALQSFGSGEGAKGLTFNIALKLSGKKKRCKRSLEQQSLKGKDNFEMHLRRRTEQTGGKDKSNLPGVSSICKKNRKGVKVRLAENAYISI